MRVRIKLVKVKGHSGYIGNDCADALAVAGAEGPRPALPPGSKVELELHAEENMKAIEDLVVDFQSPNQTSGAP